MNDPLLQSLLGRRPVAASPVGQRAFPTPNEMRLPPGTTTAQMPSATHRFSEVDTVDPLARLLARGRGGMTVGDTARMYRQGETAAGFGGTMNARGIRGYHGSPNDFDRFDSGMSRSGNYGRANYFHEAAPDAERYRPEGGRVYEASLALRRPFDMAAPVPADDAARIQDAVGRANVAAMTRETGEPYRTGSELWYWGMGQETTPEARALALRSAGYDGVIGDPGREIGGRSTRSREIAVFDDSLIEILRKYGIGGLGIGLGAATTGTGQQ